MGALRLYYLASYAGLGAVLPLLALAMQARGLQPSQYAFLLALLPLSRLGAPPLWGALADRFVGTSRLIQVNTALAAVAMMVLASAHEVVPTALGFVLWALTSSSLVPLADAGAYRMLGPDARSFARVRLFGSLGFLASALGVSLAGVDPQLRLPFVVAAFGYATSSLVSSRLADGAPTSRAPIVPALRALARRPDVLLLWLGSTLHYTGHGVFDAYFGPHASTVPGVSASMISAAWALAVGCEVVVLWFAPRLLASRLRPILLPFSALVAVGRWLTIGEARTPLAIWLEQPLHAITFALWYASFTHENQTRADPGIRATVQGMAMACMGLGNMVAILVGGTVLEQLGGRALFRCAAGAALLAGCCYAVRARVLARDNALASVSAEP